MICRKNGNRKMRGNTNSSLFLLWQGEMVCAIAEHFLAKNWSGKQKKGARDCQNVANVHYIRTNGLSNCADIRYIGGVKGDGT